MNNSTSKRIAILCSDDAHHKYLIRTLASQFKVTAVVVEPGQRQRLRLLRSGKYVNYGYTMYHHLRRTLLGLNAYRRGYFNDLPISAPGGYRSIEVDWINDLATIELLKETQPDLTIVICTSILKPEVLAAAGSMIINVHGGFLPFYRGNHCFFFPFYRGEFDKIGSTLHFVDPGIDTGAIIENIIPLIRSDDSPETLYCRAEKMAIDRLAEWIAYWESGGTIPRRPQQQRFRLNRTRDRGLWHDVDLWCRRVTGRFSVPERPGVPLEFIQTDQLKREGRG